MIPAPFSWLAAGGVWLLEMAWRTFTHITGNVAVLGWPWVLAYWLAVVGLVQLGQWGSVGAGRALAGNDLWEVDPGRRGGSWVGRPTALVLRAKVAVPAWIAAFATLIGYGGAFALLVVGIVWQWLAVAAGWWAMSRALHARRLRNLRK